LKARVVQFGMLGPNLFTAMKW